MAILNLPFGTRTPAAAEHAPVVVILTSRQRLWQRYGLEGLAAIERAVHELTEAMALRGLQGLLVYADDSPFLGRLGILPAETGYAESMSRLLRALAGRLAHVDDEVRYVLLLGGDDVVPFARVANPSPDDEDDLYSDHLYAVDPVMSREDGPREGATDLGRPNGIYAAATEAGPNMVLPPTRAVGRIPDGSLEQLVNALRMAAAAHRRLAAGKRPRLKDEAWGYSASVWRRSARGAFAALGEPEKLRLSPPLTHIDLPHPGADGPRFRYYNLHGLPDSAHWFGQRDATLPADYPLFPIALRPEDMAPAPGSVIFSAACFGAHLTDRGVDESVALSALAGGALAFVGATGVAYGGLDGPLVAADLLAYRFWEALRRGAPAGLALARAKWAVMNEALERQGYLDAEDEKTIQNFVLYGDPSLVHAVPAAWSGAISERAATGFCGRAAVGLGERTLAGASGASEWMGGRGREAARTSHKTTAGSGHSVQSSQSPHSAMHQPAHLSPPSIHVHHPAAERSLPDSSASRGLVDHVRIAVARRLPEFASCKTSLDLAPRAETINEAGDNGRASAKAGREVGAQQSSPSDRLVVTLSKSVRTADGTTCREIMRVTVEPTGRIRKLALSR